MKYLFLSVLLVSSLPLWAGDKVGNGGDVIVCPDQRTIILDIFQGKQDWGFEEIPRGGTRTQIITDTLNKFMMTDPLISQKLLSRAMELEKELAQLEQSEEYKSKLVKLTKNELVNISDEGVAELPPGCQIVQAATQIQMPFPGEVKFTFQKKTWQSLDTDVQASLILHEVIYEHMIFVGEYYSRSARYMNAALHAGNLDTVRGYFDVSSLFVWTNLNIVESDKIARFFGASNKCKIVYRRESRNDNQMAMLTITIGRKTVVGRMESFRDGMNNFWQKYVQAGACD
jgi:hypothetical protein